VRDSFIRKLTELALVDDKIFLLVGDLGYGVVEDFASRFPNRFLNTGISEQNMMGVAAGLAKSGYKVYVYSIANFPTMRCLEQIRNDVAFHDLDVTVVAIGAGFGYGTLGYSHFAVEDLAVLRALPNIKIFSPSDPYELEVTLGKIRSIPGAKYLRLGKNGEVSLGSSSLTSPLEARELRSGSELIVLSTGGISHEVIKAIDSLEDVNRFKVAHFTVPSLQYETLESLDIQSFNRILTVEEHCLDAGFGSFILEYLEIQQVLKPVKRIGIPRNFNFQVGDQEYLRKLAGLDSESISLEILKFLRF
jgi:transketolase